MKPLLNKEVIFRKEKFGHLVLTPLLNLAVNKEGFRILKACNGKAGHEAISSKCKIPREDVDEFLLICRKLGVVENRK